MTWLVPNSISLSKMIMKRVIILFLALLAAFASAQAQTNYENFTLGENRYLLGNSFDDKNYYTASSGNKGDVTMATRIAPENYKALKNCRAVGIRFALPTSVEVKQVTLYTNSKSVKYKVTPGKVVGGWNYVPFETPQTLSTAGVYVGYTYVQTESFNCQGICHWDTKVPDGYWMCFNGMWNDWSEFYGALCIQLVVEADPLPDYDLVPTSVDNVPVVMNEEGSLAVHFISNGKKAISNFDYSLSVGDEQTSGTITPAVAIAAGLNHTADAVISVPALSESGTYDARLTITAINGEDLDAAPSSDFKLDVLTRRVARRTVVEENTGTGCGNCPRAWVGMEYLKEHLPETCIGIAIHQYNGSDPMYCERYANLGFGGAAPLCMVDRKVMTDPYYGTEKLGIDRDVERYNAIAPRVDVKVEGMFTADMKKVTCSAEVEWLIDTGKYTIAYVLTADALQPHGPSWLQKNDYQIANANTQNILDHMQEFTQFFKGEENGKSLVSLVYNDVLIGSSYSASGANLTKALGTSRHTAGEIIQHSYSCAISSSAEAKEALDYDNIYVNALVIDTEGKIANAARSRVKLYDGLHTVIAENPDETAVFYDLCGRQHAAPVKGVNILNGRKVIK